MDARGCAAPNRGFVRTKGERKGEGGVAKDAGQKMRMGKI